MLDSQLAPNFMLRRCQSGPRYFFVPCHTVTLKPSRNCCAGAKADPTQVRIADISESNVDPLARAVRHRLRRQLGVEAGIPVLLSTEKPRCRLVPIAEVGENPLDYQVVS